MRNDDKKLSVMDAPKKADEEDLLNMNKYAEALAKFIEASDTPMTIALQGEWGSGKTSLMNIISQLLCEGENKKFDKIEINTWEYYILGNEQETLQRIIFKITNDIMKIRNVDNNDFKRKASKIIQSFANVAVSVLHKNTGVDFNKFYEGLKEEQSLKDFREDLEKLIDAVVKDTSNNVSNKGFIFFIDDLDRIEPEVAVKILEVLKNIFDIKNCVFILALDYDVVIKGLKSKFGELTDKNEREFRAYFDKIIQLPFTMPVANYKISELLNKLLISIDYFSEIDLTQELSKDIEEIVMYSIGNNPRSIKRLINSLSLVNIINGNDKTNLGNIKQKSINFILLSIQNAYPNIYEQLRIEPDFNTWDNSIMKSNEKGKDKNSNNWDEKLENICKENEYYKSNKDNISYLLKITKDLIADDNKIGSFIGNTLELSSYTSLQSRNISKVNSGKKYSGVTNDEILKNPFISKLYEGLKKAQLHVCTEEKYDSNNAGFHIKKKNLGSFSMDIYKKDSKRFINFASINSGYLGKITINIKNIKDINLSENIDIKKFYDKLVELDEYKERGVRPNFEIEKIMIEEVFKLMIDAIISISNLRV